MRISDWSSDVCSSDLHVCADDAAMARIAELVGFVAPEVEVLRFPAWDCLPYDRVPPRPDIVADRLVALPALAEGASGAPRPGLPTVHAALTRVAAPATIAHIGRAPGRARERK